MLYSVSDVCQLVGVTRQSVVHSLKHHRIVNGMDKIGNKYMLTQAQLERLLFLSYPKVYYMVTNKEDNAMEIIPNQIGKIQKVSSGKHLYYYIRNFPLSMDGKKYTYFKSNGYTSKEEAESVRNDLIARRTKGEFLKDFPCSNNSYYEYCVNYIEHKKIKDSTREGYRNFYCRFKEHFSNTPVTSLDRNILQKFLNSYDNGIPTMCKILSMTLKELFLSEVLDKNLYLLLVKPKVKHKPKKRALTKDELNIYLNYMKGCRLEHLILLMFSTGLRCGEACALKWDDIVFTSNSSGYVIVNKTVSRIGKQTIVTSPKTESSNRKVYFNNKELIDKLKEVKSKSNSRWVAPTAKDKDKPMNPILVNNYYFRESSIKSGIPRITSHYARVTYASYALEKGMSIKNLQKQLGHTNSILIHTVYAQDVGTTESQVNSINLFD